MGVLTKMR